MNTERKSGLVAIIGRPNAGKSTLLNRVLGSQVSIVTPKAQTTRERVLGILTNDAGQIVFVDTPGIHKAKAGGFNEFMVGEAAESLDGPNLIWYLVDPDSELEHEKTVLDLLIAKADRRTPVAVLLNKSDVRAKSSKTDTLIAGVEKTLNEAGFTQVQVSQISGRRGAGVEELVKGTFESMPEGPFLFPDEDQLSDRPLRFFAAEKIREQLFMQLGDELPYSCAVEITRFAENVKPLRIEATIHVERDSQKGMVIGAGGKKIKDIGTVARESIEEFVGEKIFLGLKVDVLKDWSRDAENLKKLGYHLPEKGKRSK